MRRRADRTRHGLPACALLPVGRSTTGQFQTVLNVPRLSGGQRSFDGGPRPHTCAQHIGQAARTPVAAQYSELYPPPPSHMHVPAS